MMELENGMVSGAMPYNLDDAPAKSMLPSISFSQHDIKTWRRSSSMPPLKGTDLNGREWNLADLKG